MKHLNLSKVIFWSDSCASQFRSRFVFKLLAHFRPELEISWHYNEAHHGKEPMDGIPRDWWNSKDNVVYRQVNSNHATINSVRESETMLEPDDISNASPIPSTLKIKRLVRRVKESDAEIEFSFLSNSDELCPGGLGRQHEMRSCGKRFRIPSNV